MSPIVRVDNVSKRFVLQHDKSLKERFLNAGRRRKDGFWALQNVSVEMQVGSTVGLVGHNGSGKSTLLKIIGGIIEPTSGSVWRRGRLAALLELGAGFHPDLTGRENVYLNAAILGLSRRHTESIFDSIVDFSGVERFIDNQVKFYSSGMYVRLAFAVAVHSDPDLLLVDEVLAVGDEPFQAKCMAKIREFQTEGRTIVLVSHSSEQVADLCDRVVVLENGAMIHDGNVESGINALRASFDHVPEGEQGSKSPFRIRAVDLLVNGRASTGTVRPGDDLRVRADIEIAEPTPWIAGFTIKTPSQHTIYRLNTEGLSLEVPSAPGRYTIEFRLPETNFGGGEYVLDFGAETPARERLDIRREVLRFSTPYDPFGAGVLQFDASGGVTPWEGTSGG